MRLTKSTTNSINLAKLQVQAFLATLGVRVLGGAVSAHKLDFSHRKFDGIKTFLQTLLS